MLLFVQETKLVQSPRVGWTESNNKPPPTSSKIEDPPNFQGQVPNDQLEKPIAKATLEFDIGDNIFTEHVVVMNYRIALHGTKQCSHWHHTWPHPFPTPDNASKKRCHWNKCQTSTSLYSWQHNSTVNDNKNIFSICRLPIGMANNRYSDTSGKNLKSSESANIPLNFNDNWQKDSS